MTKFETSPLRTDSNTAANIVLAIGGLNGFVSTEVQTSTFVRRLKFSAKNPAHRQYAARYMQACFAVTEFQGGKI